MFEVVHSDKFYAPQPWYTWFSVFTTVPYHKRGPCRRRDVLPLQPLQPFLGFEGFVWSVVGNCQQRFSAYHDLDATGMPSPLASEGIPVSLGGFCQALQGSLRRKILVKGDSGAHSTARTSRSDAFGFL